MPIFSEVAARITPQASMLPKGQSFIRATLSCNTVVKRRPMLDKTVARHKKGAGDWLRRLSMPSVRRKLLGVNLRSDFLDIVAIFHGLHQRPGRNAGYDDSTDDREPCAFIHAKPLHWGFA